MKKNLLVTLADKNYINQAKQLFSSAYLNAGWRGDYMLLAHQIPEKELKWFRDRGILIKECKPLEKKSKGLPKYIYVNKFYLFTEEFKKWKIIVYLDADIIVRGSLGGLTKIKWFAAVEDANNNKLKVNFISAEEAIKQRGNDEYGCFLQLKKTYDLETIPFHTGLIVINTNIIGKKTFFQLMELHNYYSKINIYGDQPTLNLFFYKKWKKLPLAYHIFFGCNQKTYYMPSEKIKAICFHFCYPNKPWTKTNPFYGEWKSNLEKADCIDFKKPRNTSNKRNSVEVGIYSSYLEVRRIIQYLICFFDRSLGQIGISLRNYSMLLNRFFRGNP